MSSYSKGNLCVDLYIYDISLRNCDLETACTERQCNHHNIMLEIHEWIVSSVGCFLTTRRISWWMDPSLGWPFLRDHITAIMHFVVGLPNTHTAIQKTYIFKGHVILLGIYLVIHFICIVRGIWMMISCLNWIPFYRITRVPRPWSASSVPMKTEWQN